jgi:hypothetical protein
MQNICGLVETSAPALINHRVLLSATGVDKLSIALDQISLDYSNPTVDANIRQPPKPQGLGQKEPRPHGALQRERPL